jgi:hypothetical protein
MELPLPFSSSENVNVYKCVVVVTTVTDVTVQPKRITGTFCGTRFLRSDTLFGIFKNVSGDWSVET